MKDIIIGTAGHIDHGKTTLVKALTGIDTDRLEEEKRRGITIDLGFAHLELGSFRIGFIDVPGHEKFVKNMLAGIGGIHLVLLVVAADESVMPQTVEHFHICRLLDIPRGIVVVTKKDQVEKEFLSLVEEELRDLVQDSFLAHAPLLAVDSISGEGLENLKAAILREIESLQQESAPQVFRLPIDRVFTMRGFGTVVTGTLYAGEIEKDDGVAVYPSGKEGRVRGIEIFNRKEEVARSGQRTALNLTGLQKQDLERGMTLAIPGAFQPSYMFDAVVHLLADAPAPLEHRSPIRFHHGSAELMGRIHLLETAELRPGRSGLAQLRLETPTVCCPKDRFILRRYSPITTIGGGVILDNAPQKHASKGLASIVAELQKLQSFASEKKGPATDAALVEYLVKSRGPSGMTIREMVSRTGLLENHLLEVLKQLPTAVLVPQEPVLAIFKESLQEVRDRIIRFLEDFHARNPLAEGAPREELKTKLLKQATSACFQFVLDDLEKEQRIQTTASTLALHGKRAALIPRQQHIREQIIELIEKSNFQPPGLAEVLQQLAYPADEIRNVFYFLLQKGELVRVSEEIVVLSKQIDGLKQLVKESFPPGRLFSVPEFKDRFQLSRKYAIPYLEFLDRERVTRRVGDKRVVIARADH